MLPDTGGGGENLGKALVFPVAVDRRGATFSLSFFCLIRWGSAKKKAQLRPSVPVSAFAQRHVEQGLRIVVLCCFWPAEAP